MTTSEAAAPQKPFRADETGGFQRRKILLRIANLAPFPSCSRAHGSYHRILGQRTQKQNGKGKFLDVGLQDSAVSAYSPTKHQAGP